MGDEMHDKTASTKVFKARSGRTVRPLASGDLAFDHGNGYLDRFTATDAEEYFQAKRDEGLGCWRVPTEPTLVVYPKASGDVLVFDELRADFGVFSRDGDLNIGRPVYKEAARAYFEAHPEPTLGQDAKYGEVWAVTETTGKQLYRVTHDLRFDQVSGGGGRLSMPITHRSITDARRIWPEVAS